jgi:hypothetical protein
MNEFLKFFRFIRKDKKEIEIYILVNKYSYEIRPLNWFANILEYPPIFSLEAENLWTEITIIFSNCQKEGYTKIGLNKKDEIVESNLISLYVEFEKLISKNLQLELKQKNIKTFSNDKTTYCYKYFDLNKITYNTPVKTPFLNYFCAGFSEADELRFKLYLATIFDASNHSKQMLYMYDPHGDSGKSAFINALVEFIGNSFCLSPNENYLNSRFGLISLKNKRLITISENKNANFLFSQMIQAILGGDIIDAEEKGVQILSNFTPEAKIIVASNDPINTTNNHHHNSKLIICKINEERRIPAPSGMFKDDRTYKFGTTEMTKIYLKELPNFITTCIELYNNYDRPNKVPPVEGYTSLDSYISDQNRIIEEVFDNYFTYTTETNIRIPKSCIVQLRREINNLYKEEDINYKISTAQLVKEFKLKTVNCKNYEYITNIQFKPGWTYDETTKEIIQSKYSKNNNDTI